MATVGTACKLSLIVCERRTHAIFGRDSVDANMSNRSFRSFAKDQQLFLLQVDNTDRDRPFEDEQDDQEHELLRHHHRAIGRYLRPSQSVRSFNRARSGTDRRRHRKTSRNRWMEVGKPRRTARLSADAAIAGGHRRQPSAGLRTGARCIGSGSRRQRRRGLRWLPSGAHQCARRAAPVVETSLQYPGQAWRSAKAPRRGADDHQRMPQHAPEFVHAEAEG